jgi:hypothetical protein
MQSHGIEMIVLVKNRAIFEYQHNNQVFIEGRQGSNYEIELRNHTLARVQAILSVDGLSVIDGQKAGANSRSYLIEPGVPLRIPGWLINEQNAAKFAFAGKQDSYASQISDGQTRNIGVIGVLVYTEKMALSYPTYPTFQNPFYTWNIHSGLPTSNPLSGTGVWDSPRGIACSSNISNATPFIGTAFSNKTMNQQVSDYNASVAAPAVAKGGAQQSLGTAFGEQTQFATRSVAFDRGEQLIIMSLYYDSIMGLRHKGVPIERRGKGKAQRPPEAFPGMCQPPRGWRDPRIRRTGKL